MTEKRFILDDPMNYRSTCVNTDNCIEGFALVENEAPFQTFNLEKVVDLLNNLYEEKEQLKQEVESLEDEKYNYKEDWRNVSLKCDEYKCEIKSLQEDIKDIISENEKLKEKNTKLTDILNDMNISIDETLTLYDDMLMSNRFEYSQDVISNRVMYSIYDNQTNQNYSKEGLDELTGVLNAFHRDSINKTKVLNDMINMLNRLQANPDDDETLSVARSMLQNMGVDLE